MFKKIKGRHIHNLDPISILNCAFDFAIDFLHMVFINWSSTYNRKGFKSRMVNNITYRNEYKLVYNIRQPTGMNIYPSSGSSGNSCAPALLAGGAPGQLRHRCCRCCQYCGILFIAVVCLMLYIIIYSI